MCYTLLPTWALVSRLIIITRNSIIIIFFFLDRRSVQLANENNFNKTIILLVHSGFNLLKWSHYSITVGNNQLLAKTERKKNDFKTLTTATPTTLIVDSHRFGIHFVVCWSPCRSLFVRVYLCDFRFSIKNAWLKWLNQLS